MSGTKTVKVWQAGSAVPDMNYSHKNCLAHILHAPKRDDVKSSSKVGFKKQAKMMNSETWARAQMTAAGKPGSEWPNRPAVALSGVTSAMEVVKGIMHNYAGNDGFFGKGLERVFAAAFDTAMLPRTSEVLNSEDYPGASASKPETEMATEAIVKSLLGMGKQWVNLCDLMLLSHNLYVSLATIMTGVAYVNQPNILCADFCNAKNVPADTYQAWIKNPAHGPTFVKFLATCAWQHNAEKRHSDGAPRGEEPAGTIGLTWSPRADRAETDAQTNELDTSIARAQAFVKQRGFQLLGKTTITAKEKDTLKKLFHELPEEKKQFKDAVVRCSQTAGKSKWVQDQSSVIKAVIQLFHDLCQQEESIDRMEVQQCSVDALLASPTVGSPAVAVSMLLQSPATKDSRKKQTAPEANSCSEAEPAEGATSEVRTPRKKRRTSGQTTSPSTAVRGGAQPLLPQADTSPDIATAAAASAVDVTPRRTKGAKGKKHVDDDGTKEGQPDFNTDALHRLIEDFKAFAALEGTKRKKKRDYEAIKEQHEEIMKQINTAKIKKAIDNKTAKFLKRSVNDIQADATA